MLDLKFLKENANLVKANVASRGMNIDVDDVIRLYDRRNTLIAEADALRRRRNENAQAMKKKLNPDERERLINEGRAVKETLAAKEAEESGAKSALEKAASFIPNMAHPDAPIGREDKENTEIARHGEPTVFDFAPKDHVQIAQDLDLIDFEAGAKVSGSKFYFLKNEAVLLELALIRYALDILSRRGFQLTATPDIARNEIVGGIGFNPRGAESNIFTLEGLDVSLVATAEITLGGYHAGDIVNLDEGPILMAGFSHCFRREAGAAGQYSRGLYRVHQFSKVEMFVYCKAHESHHQLDTLLDIEKEIFAGLNVPFRVVDTCTGDLGAQAHRKFDLEAWMPGRDAWGEVTSASNCTDYQARRLGIRYREDGRTRHVHTLNGTAVAVSRAIIAVLENGQRADGSVAIPESLAPYCGFSEIPSR